MSITRDFKSFHLLLSNKYLKILVIVFSSITTVSAKLKLVDVKTGSILWESVAFASRDSGDGGGSFAGMLIGAIATQIMESSFDRSHEISMLANTAAINHPDLGLLDGPYKIIDK